MYFSYDNIAFVYICLATLTISGALFWVLFARLFELYRTLYCFWSDVKDTIYTIRNTCDLLSTTCRTINNANITQTAHTFSNVCEKFTNVHDQTYPMIAQLKEHMKHAKHAHVLNVVERTIHIVKEVINEDVFTRYIMLYKQIITSLFKIQTAFVDLPLDTVRQPTTISPINKSQANTDSLKKDNAKQTTTEDVNMIFQPGHISLTKCENINTSNDVKRTIIDDLITHNNIKVDEHDSVSSGNED